MTMRARWFRALVAVALATGCGGGAQVDPIDAELCEHLEGGEVVQVTAVASGDASGAAISDDHRRYEVTLAQGGGSVSFAADASGEFVFGLSEDLPVTVQASSGAAVTLEDTRTGALACTGMKKRFAADLPVVGTYTLTFGPSTLQKVAVVVEHGVH